MSVVGHKRKSAKATGMSAFGVRTDIAHRLTPPRLTPLQRVIWQSSGALLTGQEEPLASEMTGVNNLYESLIACLAKPRVGVKRGG